MLEHINEENVDVRVHAADWEDAIRISAQHLLETGKIEERYIGAMIDAVHRVGPYIVFGKSCRSGSCQTGMRCQ
ncbi:MAG: PTS sugar transporter subunit IIA [Clostridium sp.]